MTALSKICLSISILSPSAAVGIAPRLGHLAWSVMKAGMAACW